MLLALTSGVLVWAQREVTVDDKNVDVKTMIYDGIDVSSYQMDIDWSATAKDKNIKFVYVKATEGASYRSRHYERNIENARKEGIRVGSYHFFRTTTTVQDQFNNFTAIVKKEDQDLIPLIDVEVKKNWTAQQLADSVLEFAHMLEDYYGCRPMIYTGSAFYNSYLSGRISGYPLFIARYSKQEPHLTGGVKWILWQFSERGRITGIDHAVDLCRFNKGCSLSDILIKKKVSHRNKNEVPARKPAAKKKEEPQVPLSKKDLEKQQKEAKEKAEKDKKAKEKAEKEAKKKAEKRAKEVADSTKQAKKAAEKEAKRQAELKKEQEKKRQEEAKKKKEAAEKAAKAKAEKEAKEKAEKAKKAKEEAVKKSLEAAKKQSANQKAKSQGKRVNGTSADND